MKGVYDAEIALENHSCGRAELLLGQWRQPSKQKLPLLPCILTFRDRFHSGDGDPKISKGIRVGGLIEKVS